MKAAAFGLAACLGVSLSGACPADELVAAEQVGGTSVGFVLKGAYSNATLTVAGPGNFYAQTFSRGGAVALNLTQFGALPDGTYNYQLTAAGSAVAAAKGGLDDGRGDARKFTMQTPMSKSGTFNVKGGKIVDYGMPAQPHRRDAR